MHGDSSIEHTKAGVIGTTMFVLELICFNVQVFVLDLVDSSIFTNSIFTNILFIIIDRKTIIMCILYSHVRQIL